MKKCVNHWAFQPDIPLTDCFKYAAEANFDAIELNVALEGPIKPDASEKEVKTIAEQARNQGLEISSVSSAFFWSKSLTSDCIEDAETARDFVKSMLQIARWLGTDSILVVPGSVDEKVSYEVAYQRAQQTMQGLIHYAESQGVVIGVENVWNNMFLSPLEAARFIDEIGSPWIQWYFDVGNVVYNGYPEQWIKILGKRIRRVHIKDYDRNIPGFPGFKELLEGSVDYAAVMSAFREIGYDKYITAEVGARDREGILKLGQVVSEIASK